MGRRVPAPCGRLCGVNSCPPWDVFLPEREFKLVAGGKSWAPLLTTNTTRIMDQAC